MLKEDEIDLATRECHNVAFNGNGTIAVVLGLYSEL
jgi:hypothetical protein